MPPVIETRYRWLPQRVDERRTFLHEGHTHGMRASGYGEAHLQISVGPRVVAVRGSLNGERLDRLPVDEHQQLVRPALAQTADDAFQIARQHDLDVVVAVLSERMQG